MMQTFQGATVYLPSEIARTNVTIADGGLQRSAGRFKASGSTRAT